jgi:hypothetical protein
MEITTYIAVYGAVISTIALGWNIYKQATNGPKLVAFAASNADFRGEQVSVSLYGLGIILRVMNRGNAETTVQKIGLRSFHSGFDFVRGRICAEPALPHVMKGDVPPYPLPAGAEFRYWIPQEQYVGLSRVTRLYFYVVHSMSDKPMYVRVWPIKDE